MEDYRTARVLARIEHMGEAFTIVRRRMNGKPWRKYLVLLHNGEEMSASSMSGETAPEVFQANMRESLARAFPPGREEYFRESLKAQHDRAARGVLPR